MNSGEKREISNIENIYRRVFGKYLHFHEYVWLNTYIEEFSNFSKNFESRAPKQKEEIKDFLNVFEQVKQDPMTINENKDDDDIVVSDFLKYDKEGVIRSEAFYCTKMGEVKGTLAFFKNYM